MSLWRRYPSQPLGLVWKKTMEHNKSTHSPSKINVLQDKINTTRNVGQCPTWWPLCRIQAVPSVQRRKVWLTPTTRVPCTNAAKTRNPLKCAGVPQTRQQISAVSRPKFTILWGHVEEVLVFNKFFPIADTCLSCEDIARQSRAIVHRWRIFGEFLHPVFSASHMQHISNLHPKFALRPHHVWKYGRHPISDRWD